MSDVRGATPASTVCRACGDTNRPDARFCKRCGTRQERHSEPSTPDHGSSVGGQRLVIEEVITPELPQDPVMALFDRLTNLKDQGSITNEEFDLTRQLLI